MKRIVLILLIVTLVFAFAACKATPEKQTVAGKDTERMTRKVSEGEEGARSLAELGVPAGPYTFETEGAGGKLRVSVDAEVETPDAETIPVARVSMDIFTQEQVTGMFHYLFPGEKPTEIMPQAETKPQIEEMIIDLRRRMEEARANGENTADMEEQAAALEALYQDAPEADPVGGASDGTLAAPPGDPGEPFRSLTVNGRDAFFTVSTYADASAVGKWGGGSYLLYYVDQSKGRVYSNRVAELDGNAKLPEDAAQRLAVSFEEARQMCEGFLEAAGAGDEVCLGSAFLLDGYNSNLETDSGNFAYEFYYTRTLNGIPLFYFDDTGLMTDTSGEEGFEVPWSYESIRFQVDNDGIVNIEWSDPVAIGETAQEAPALLPFSEVMDVFAAMVKIYYEPVVTTIYNGEVELDITVDEIRLVPLRIREQGAAQTEGLVVPAWIFYGENRGTRGDEVRYLGNEAFLRSQTDAGRFAAEGYEDTAPTALEQFDWASEQPRKAALMAVNAIDGSVIDLSRGY